MRNRVVESTLAALMGLTLGALVGCQSMRPPAAGMMEIAESGCRDAVVKRLQGISPSEIFIDQSSILIQGDFIALDWRATDRLARGQCLLNKDGSLAKFMDFPADALRSR